MTPSSVVAVEPATASAGTRAVAEQRGGMGWRRRPAAEGQQSAVEGKACAVAGEDAVAVVAVVEAVVAVAAEGVATTGVAGKGQTESDQLPDAEQMV